MYSMIDPISLRISNIVDLLWVEENCWLTYKYIADTLEVSSKTIANDFKFIENEYADILRISNSPYGVKCESISNSTVSKINNLLIKDSTKVMLIQELFLNPKEDIFYYANNCYMSCSNIYKILPLIEFFLNKHDIFIQKKEGLYSLYSKDEAALRIFFTGFFLDIFNFSIEKHLEPNLFQTLKEAVELLLQRSSLGIERTYWITYFYISLLREQQGFRINNSDVTQPISTDDTIDDIMEEVKKIFVHAEFVTEQTREPFFENMSSLLFHEQLETVDKECLDKVNRLLFFFDYLNLDESFILNKRLTHSLSYFTDDNESLLTSISECVRKDPINSSHIHSDFLLYLLVIYFPIIIATPKRSDILIVSEFSKEHAVFLYNFIYKRLNQKVIINKKTCIAKQQLDAYNLSDYDYIITNAHDVYSDYYDMGNVILINDIPHATNINKMMILHNQ